MHHPCPGTSAVSNKQKTAVRAHILRNEVNAGPLTSVFIVCRQDGSQQYAGSIGDPDEDYAVTPIDALVEEDG